MNSQSIAGKLSIATATVAFLTLGTVNSASSASLYSITELPFTPSDINDLGQVVGSQYLWENGTTTDLGFLPGSNSTDARGINNLGQVVGSSGDDAFIWQNGIISNLGTVPASICSFCRYASANGINDKGQVVGMLGFTQPVPFYPSSFIWDNGTLIDMYLGGGGFTFVYGINNAGKAIMLVGVKGSSSVVVWHNGTFSGLKTPPGLIYSFGTDINNADQVVGSGSNFITLTVRALLWDGDTAIDLGNFGINSAVANGINDATLVVGESQISTETSHAFLWEKGKMFDLNKFIPANSGWELFSASEINNKNQIIGTGKFNGETRGFLLTPEAESIPEPTSALGVLSLGGLGIGWRLLRKRKAANN